MEVLKIVFLIAIMMALSVTLTMKTMIKIEEGGTITNDVHDHGHDHDQEEVPELVLPSKRVSRFLAENDQRNPRAADHCHKDHEVCHTLAGGKNSTCCNNKCMDLGYDRQNCGACKKKCKYTQACCRGECVELAYDKRHCGMCNHRCERGQYCVYGMCNYA